jgi:hypothetical protein
MGQRRAKVVDTREGDVVTAPVDFNVSLLPPQDEENDKSGDSDG